MKYLLLLLLIVPCFGCNNFSFLGNSDSGMFNKYEDSSHYAHIQWMCCFDHHNDSGTRYWDGEFNRFGDTIELYKKRLYPNGFPWEKEDSALELKIQKEQQEEKKICNCK